MSICNADVEGLDKPVLNLCKWPVLIQDVVTVLCDAFQQAPCSTPMVHVLYVQSLHYQGAHSKYHGICCPSALHNLDHFVYV